MGRLLSHAVVTRLLSEISLHARCDNLDMLVGIGIFVREMQNRVFHLSFGQVSLHSLRTPTWRLQAYLCSALQRSQLLPQDHAAAILNVGRSD
jgi:hypothetical protein